MMQQPIGQGQAQVFIGRVPPSVDLAALEEQLVPFGASNCRMLPGKGCAFADFQSVEAAEVCIESMNGTRLTTDSTVGLNVKFADTTGGPKETDAPQRTTRAVEPKVFVGGLAHGVTEESILDACSHYGAVYEAKLFSKRPGAPLCAFVLFSSFGEAESCINGMHGLENDLTASGKTLNVRLAEPQQSAKAPAAPSKASAVASAAGKPQVPVPKAVAPLVPSGGAYVGCGGGSRPGRPSNGGPGSLLPPPQGSQKLFVGGLPEDASEDFLRGLMSLWGDVVEAKLHRKLNALPCGFVRFATQEEAELAIESHGQVGKYTVKIATENKRSHGRAFDDASSGL